MTLSLIEQIAAEQAKAAASNAGKGGNSGDWINQQQMPEGRHVVRMFRCPKGLMYHEWAATYVNKDHRKQADPRSFPECDAGIAARVTAALSIEGYPYKAAFWEHSYMFMHIYETSVTNNQYWKSGQTYIVLLKYHTRDAILESLAGFAGKFEDDLAKSLDIKQNGWGLNLKVEKKASTCQPDIMGDELASPYENIKVAQYVPLNDLFKYDIEIANDIVEKVEKVAADINTAKADTAAAQVPPEETAAPAATAPAATAQSPVYDDDIPF